MLIDWEMVGEAKICKRKTNSKYLFLPFNAIEYTYITYPMNSQITGRPTVMVGQVMHVFFNRFLERIVPFVLPNDYWNKIPSQRTSIFQRLFSQFDSTKPWKRLD